MHPENLHVYASYFHNYGFNVTHIVPLQTDEMPFIGEKSYKSPSITHNIKHLITEKQDLSELSSYNWKLASGIGVVLGFNLLRAIDIDKCYDFNFVQNLVRLLRLPTNYKWIIKSGSNSGYHIIFYAEDHGYVVEPNQVKAFRPNLKYHKQFKHIELRWTDHLVLPPSLHYSGNKYEFINGFPEERPSKIKIENLKKAIDEISKKGDEEVNDSDFQLRIQLDSAMDGISGNHLSFD
jgi:hypothetical protein